MRTLKSTGAHRNFRDHATHLLEIAYDGGSHGINTYLLLGTVQCLTTSAPAARWPMESQAVTLFSARAKTH